MQKLKNKNFLIILEFIISVLLVKGIIILFHLTNNSFYVVLAVSGLMFLMNKIINKKELILKKTTLIATSIYSILISIALVIQNKITFCDDVGLKYDQNTFSNFQISDILRFLIIFCVAYIIVLTIIILTKNKKISIIDDKKEKLTRKQVIIYWIIATISVAACYIIYLLTYAPGAVLGDSLGSIVQGIGEAKFNNHNPVLYSMFIGIFMNIGKSVNNFNFGTMLYSITQLLIISGIIGYFLIWLKKYNVKLVCILLTWLFFVANTVFSSYAIIMWKDPLFCAFIFLMVLTLFDTVYSKGENLKKPTQIIKFIILTILIAFFRNNGFLIVIFNYLALLIIFRKKLLVLNIINTIIIALIFIIQGPVYSKLGIVSPFEESVGIPLQQIARVIVYDGKISNEQKEFINTIMPEEEWKDSYTPCIVDTIKWNPKFDKVFLQENRVEFIKMWAQILPSNLSNYIKAYLMNTYGFWSLETKNKYGYVDTYIIDNSYGIKRTDYIEKYLGFSLESKLTKPDFLGSGTLMWIMLLSIFLLIINKNYKYILVLLPCIIGWVSIMIATPVAFSLRYVFMLAYALPLMIMLPMLVKNQKEEGENEK